LLQQCLCIVLSAAAVDFATLQVAKNSEVMVAISNANYARPGGMLDVWMDSLKRANVTNALVIALDDETQKHAEEMGLTAFQINLQVWKAAQNCTSCITMSSLQSDSLERGMMPHVMGTYRITFTAWVHVLKTDMCF
jgi:hypothetical protein